MANPDRQLVVGVDLGGTHFQIGVVDGEHRIVGRTRGLTLPKERSADEIAERLTVGIREVCDEAEVDLNQIRAVGVGTPAPIDRSFRIAIRAVNLDWDNFPLADRMTEYLDGAIPVTLDNDVNCAVWGEHILGAGHGFESLLGVWVGTGIGGGLVLDGQLYHGVSGTAGEIGQAVFRPDRDHSSWRYEDNASRKWIEHAIRYAVLEGRDCVLAEAIREGDGQALSSRNIAAAVEQGDELITSIIRDSARATGIMTANAITLLSLDCIVIGGGLAEHLGEQYIMWMREAFDEAVFPKTLRNCEIRATKLKENAGLLGAALLARERLVDSTPS